MVESLSGHIPRSWLRSSDLLPFYHQYPAACCGDFLLRWLPPLVVLLIFAIAMSALDKNPKPFRPSGNQQSQNAPNAPVKQQTDSAKKGQNHPNQKIDNLSLNGEKNDNTYPDESADDTSELTRVFGHEIKITDGL